MYYVRTFLRVLSSSWYLIIELPVVFSYCTQLGLSDEFIFLESEEFLDELSDFCLLRKNS
jgi:hypothetical protein